MKRKLVQFAAANSWLLLLSVTAPARAGDAYTPTIPAGYSAKVVLHVDYGNTLDKVGVEPVTLVASGSPRKHIANDIFRSWDEEDRQQVMTMLDASYDLFRQRVRDGRSGVAEKLEANPRIIDKLA